MLETFGHIWHGVFIVHWFGVLQIGHDALCLFFVYVIFSSFFSIALIVVGVICKHDMVTVILISYVFRPIHKMFKYI